MKHIKERFQLQKFNFIVVAYIFFIIAVKRNTGNVLFDTCNFKVQCLRSPDVRGNITVDDVLVSIDIRNSIFGLLSSDACIKIHRERERERE